MNTIIFDFDKYLYNLKTIKTLLANKKLCLVLKSDAYGCGLKEIIKKIVPLDLVEYIAITENTEAEIIRKYTNSIKIIRIRPAKLEEIKNGLPFNIEEIIDSPEKIDLIKNNFVNLPIHLSIDCGMNNMGMKIKDIDTNVLAQLNLVGIMTHFPSIASLDSKQLKNFDILYTKLKSEYFPNIIGHVLNSLNFINHYQDKLVYDMIRLGDILYGMNRREYNHFFSLKQTIKLECDFLAIRFVEKGENIGYNYDFTASRNMRIIVINCGYNYGYPSISNNISITKVNNVECPIVGKVSMNLMTIDITNIREEVHKVTLLGNGIYIEDIINNNLTQYSSVLINLMRNNKITYLD